MNARKNFKRSSGQRQNARLVLAAAQRRFAARVDFLVARWLARRAANAEAAQWLFETDRKPAREFGMGVSLVVSTPNWDESA
jgi:erythromycin esterase-like protein